MSEDKEDTLTDIISGILALSGRTEALREEVGALGETMKYRGRVLWVSVVVGLVLATGILGLYWQQKQNARLSRASICASIDNTNRTLIAILESSENVDSPRIQRAIERIEENECVVVED